MRKQTVSFRIAPELRHEIEKDYLGGKYSLSDFMMDAIIHYMNVKSGSDDKTLIFASMNSINQRMRCLERDLDVLFHLIDSFLRTFLLYHPEPEFTKEGIASVKSRHTKIMDAFVRATKIRKKSFIYDLFGDGGDF